MPDSVERVRPSALMLSPEAPYPLDGGGPLRTASLLQYLSRHYDVDLIAFQHPGQRIIECLPKGLVKNVGLVPLREHGTGFIARALRNGSRLARMTPPLLDRFSGYEKEIEGITAGRHYDLCLLEHFWTASYLPLSKRLADRTVLNLHNIESAWHSSCAASSRFPRSTLHHGFANAALQRERTWLSACDMALVTSKEDATRIQQIAAVPVSVYPNAIPWRKLEFGEPDLSIAFSGNMEYEPNRIGLRWFLKEIWPSIHSQLPHLQFRIVGRNAHAVGPDIRRSVNVTCTGPVEDPFEHLSRALICIAPLRSGSGTRLKIIEAWAACRAVVSTPLGAEGLGAKNDESIRMADTPGLFAASVIELVENETLRQKIANAGRVLYERKYTWNAAWNTLRGVL